MPVKITKSLSLKTLMPEIKEDFSKKRNRDRLIKTIIRFIRTGTSPVTGGKFREYANKNYKGRKKPVDMKVTGKMLDGLTTQGSKPGVINLVFKGAHAAIAYYHNNIGAGRSKVKRRLLPDKRNEQFAERVQKIIDKFIESAVRKATRKQNR